MLAPRPLLRRLNPAARPAAAARAGGWTQALLLRLTLALLLVTVQVGAGMHVIGHTADVPHAAASADAHADGNSDGHTASHTCSECIALSGIDLPLADSPRLPAPRAGDCLAGAFAAPAAAGGALPAPRCRAPPAALPG
ncbi:hypothetical protein GPA19_11445 [Azoarcus indigens]|nr:hypothetical protein [Azoarcus indigens]NMG65562.1 hypothetical protein [Azoarcus indigens]